MRTCPPLITIFVTKLTHEWHFDPELDEWDVGEGSAYDEDESVDVLHLGVVDDGSDHQEKRDQQDRDGDHDRTLVGPEKSRSAFFCNRGCFEKSACVQKQNRKLIPKGQERRRRN